MRAFVKCWKEALFIAPGRLDDDTPQAYSRSINKGERYG